jgi:hypothetical protein
VSELDILQAEADQFFLLRNVMTMQLFNKLLADRFARLGTLASFAHLDHEVSQSLRIITCQYK